MKKYIKACLVILCVLMFSACSKKNEKKDTFIGIWIAWNDSQKFVINEYIKSAYIDNKETTINYTVKDNGLFIINYIDYNGELIEDRITITSKELEVSDTEYKEDKIFNHVTINRGHTLPQNLEIYRINEKTNGEIYVDYSSKEIYYSHYGVEQKKKINRNNYKLEIDFKDIDVIRDVNVAEYTIDGELLKEYTFDYTNVKDMYNVLEQTSYVIATENYYDAKNKEYSAKEYIVFNNNIKENEYNVYLVEEGIGSNKRIKFVSDNSEN